MVASRKALSRKGTLGSSPQAKGALLALKTSHWCSRSVFRTVSLQPTEYEDLPVKITCFAQHLRLPIVLVV